MGPLPRLYIVSSEKELELEAFRMAFGGEANWRVARDEDLQSKLLEILCKRGRRTWTRSSKVSPFG